MGSPSNRSEAPLLSALRGRLIVSCQAREGEPFRTPDFQAAFARAAVEGGAAAIRANGEDDIRAIRKVVTVPVIGIRKVVQAVGRRLTTPTFDSARELVAAGASAIALEAGAWAIVVGSAITRRVTIARRFSAALENRERA